MTKISLFQCAGLFALLVLAFACYSPQTLQPDTSAPVQADAVRAARELDRINPAPGNPVLSDASRALNECAAALRTQGAKLTEAVRENNRCKAEYDVQHAELQKLRDETGLLAWLTDRLGRIGNAIFWFSMGGLFGGIVYRLLLALIARAPV